jgi:phage tail sheath protein FI
MRARASDIVIGRLETSSGAPARADSGSAGVDSVPYRIEHDADYELAVGAGTVAVARLRDDAGRVIAEVARTGDAASHPSRVHLSPGSYTLELESDDRRESHYQVLPRACANRAAFDAGQRAERAQSSAETPGLYVQQLGSGPASIVAAPTSTVAIVGQIGSGPIGTPLQLLSADDLTATFGPSAASSPVGVAVTQYFANGGSIAWVIGTSSGAASAVIGDAGSGTGLYALAGVADWALLVLPDLATMTPSDAETVLATAVPLAIHANAFTVVDAPASLVAAGDFGGWVIGALVPALPGPLPPSDVLPFAAAYFPQLAVQDPSGAQFSIAAGGAIAGMMAANDVQSGVWVSPSGGEHGALPGVVGPAQVVDEADAASLFMDRVNPIRAGASVAANAPAVVWGARTLGDEDANGADVAASRTDLYLRASIATSLQWVAFENDDAQLWQSVVQQLDAFLQDLWQAGGLTGATAADAFVVTCDASNNPLQEITSGLLHVDVQARIVGNADPTVLFFSFATDGPDGG